MYELEIVFDRLSNTWLHVSTIGEATVEKTRGTSADERCGSQRLAVAADCTSTPSNSNSNSAAASACLLPKLRIPQPS